MIGWLLYIMFFLAIWHFVYETILLPDWRDRLRIKLFVLRDEVRNMKHEKPTEFSNDVFIEVHLFLNAAINSIDKVSIFSLIRSGLKLESNPEVKEAYRQDLVRLMNNDDRLSVILKSTFDVVLRAVAANMGGNIPYLFPIFILVWAVKRLVKRCYIWLQTIVVKFLDTQSGTKLEKLHHSFAMHQVS